MAKYGPEFYDDETVFETYMARRDGRKVGHSLLDGNEDIISVNHQKRARQAGDKV
jgi:hypothetical protein